MKNPGKDVVSTRIIFFEIAAFAFMILMIWLNEFFDIPYLLLGADKTPVNWKEASFETCITSAVGIFIVYYTIKMFNRMKYLEGIHPICASCKKIRDTNGIWQTVEDYIHERSEAEFSHGICPQCAEKLYPDCNPYKD